MHVHAKSRDIHRICPESCDFDYLDFSEIHASLRVSAFFAGDDLAKSVFQAHGIDESGATVLMKKLHRKQMLPFFSNLSPCLIAMEAYGTAH